MKVKVITRNPDEYLRETKLDIHKGKKILSTLCKIFCTFIFTVQRNYDPNLHPFEAAREYTRALNAVKLEKVFAKPFLGNLDGHRDGISCISKHPKRLSVLISGAFDGEIRIWDIPQRICLRNFVAHDGIIRGVIYTPKGDQFITIGDDKTIKTWKSAGSLVGESDEPINTVISKTVLSSISHHRKKPLYATAGEICQIWDESRNEPIRTFEWGVDSLHDITFNPVETDLLSSCASDRSIILYDMREKDPLRKIVMSLKTNNVAWNPMEPFIFTCANEDYK